MADNTQTILIAVDGLSYDAFLTAQKMGYFKEFKNVGAHIAPFPSMTDLSWAQFTHTSDLFKNEGRIKSVEAAYFDDSTRSIQGDPRDYYRRLAFPKYYMNAFESFFNPYIEALMYFPTEEVPKLEVKTVIDDLINIDKKNFKTGYIGAVDSTAHTQKDRLFPVLKILDKELSRLIRSLQVEQKKNIEVVLISDHGNIGRFKEGADEKELLPVNLKDTVEKSGFNFVQQLKNENDVAAPLLALGSWAPLYLKDRKNIQPLIEAFKKEEWLDLVIYMKSNSAEKTLIQVVGKNSRAEVIFDKKISQIYYKDIANNPLQIPLDYISSEKKLIAINTTQALHITSQTTYPDSLQRIIESTSGKDFDFPDLILTLKDGYHVQSSLGAFTKMYRTHGSLSAKSSYGLLASTKRKIPGQIRTKDILPYLKIKPEEMFSETLRKAKMPAEQSLAELRSQYRKGIETKGKDLSQKRIFQHLSRFVSDTRPFFVVDEIKSFMDAFQFNPQQVTQNKELSPMQFNISKFNITSALSPEDIGAVTDAVLTSGSIENLKKDPRIEKVKQKVGYIEGTKTASLEPYALAAKRTAMKMYQIPFLLEKSFVVQERPYLEETRNLSFAKSWLDQKSTMTESFNKLTDVFGDKFQEKKPQSYAQHLFKETFKEAELEDKIYPTPLTKLYQSKLQDVTIVYVPGIYNSIFDREIFSLGLNALSDELGLRVIQPPVESTCASDYNADLIMNYIKEDFQTQVNRGKKAPQYIFLSYSKGAIDTLHAFIKNKSFVSNHVKAMVAIAAPLHGSSILNKTDLPFELVNALSEKKGPPICQTEKPASKSITPTAMDAFWRKNQRSLIGLTRLFSVTFESEPEESHIFMKATKLIAQFEENNDGVVTSSSSRFPAKLMAINLGTIKADHLAGVLSSRFNQKAFMKGLTTALAELDVDNDEKNLKWNSQVIASEANSKKWSTRTYFRLSGKRKLDIWSLDLNNWLQPKTFRNTHELNSLALPAINDPADSYEPKVKLPVSQIKYDPYSVLDVQKLPDILSATSITPATKENLPTGIQIDYHHKNFVHFRMDHQFNYESRSPGGADDNAQYGYITSEFSGEKDWALMRSHNNSIRLTTLAYRFSPLDFPEMNLRLAVTKGVRGADPVKGKTGKDDSAFQVWFTIREGRNNNNRNIVDPTKDNVFLFGYYWGDQAAGEDRKAQQIFENWYSNKNVVVATLPEAKQLLLNDQSMLGKPMDFKQNLVTDLKKAFPSKKLEELEILAITIQHDSNDAEDSSEAYFKRLSFTPQM